MGRSARSPGRGLSLIVRGRPAPEASRSSLAGGSSSRIWAFRRYEALIAPMWLLVKVRRDQCALTFEWLDIAVDPPASLAVMELAFLVHVARLATVVEQVRAALSRRSPRA